MRSRNIPLAIEQHQPIDGASAAWSGQHGVEIEFLQPFARGSTEQRYGADEPGERCPVETRIIIKK